MKRVFLTGVSLAFFLSCNSDRNEELITTNETLEVTSVNNTNKSYGIVSKEEYESASEKEKKIIDKINASLAALDQLNDENLEATVSISNDEFNTFSNSIIIAKEEPTLGITPEYETFGSCTVCGYGSAMKCLRELQKVESDDFTVRVRRKGGCVELSW